MSLDSYSSDQTIDYPTTGSSGYNLRSRSYQSGSQSDSQTPSSSDFSSSDFSSSDFSRTPKSHDRTSTYDSRTPTRTSTYDSRTPTYSTTLTRSSNWTSSSSSKSRTSDSRYNRSGAPSPSPRSWTSSKSWTSSPSSKSWTSSPKSSDSDQLYENEYEAAAANPPTLIGIILLSWLTLIFGTCTLGKHLSGSNMLGDFLQTTESLILMGLGFVLNIITLHKFPGLMTYQVKVTLAVLLILVLIPVSALIVYSGLAFLTYLFPDQIQEGMVTY